MKFKLIKDPYTHKPVALTPDQLDWLIETQTVHGNEKTVGMWLTVFQSAIDIEADTPEEAEEKHNANLN